MTEGKFSDFGSWRIIITIAVGLLLIVWGLDINDIFGYYLAAIGLSLMIMLPLLEVIEVEKRRRKR